MKLFVVLPAFNEEKSIGSVIKDLKRNNYRNIIVVDDGSVDKTSEIAKKENFINNILTNFTHECPAFPPIPSCPACPVCTIPSLPSCPSYNLTCPESQIIMPNPNEEQKPSKLPWILSGILFVMLVITFINLAKKNKESGEEVSEEFAEEFKG